ncbi:MAG: hypothetical protein IPI49_30020 [Myxococcales bacterium]|nr:hypothetical protein [Myxococcales bacterium]
MHASLVLPALSLAALAACASASPAAQTAATSPAAAASTAPPAPLPQLPLPTGAAQRLVELPPAASAGPPRQVQVLVDEPALKLATIVLRQGTVLPTHQSAVPVTIVALHGAGTVVAGTERLRLDPTHAVVLAAGVPHAVEPDATADLVLLVHHLGQAASPGHPDHHH